MNKAYQMFLPPSVKDPEALGWLVQEPDLYDGRKKYLVLNDEGRRIALLLGETLEKAEPEVVDGYRIRRPSSERGEE
jgi:DNA-binding MarR family transcriptional regulator